MDKPYRELIEYQHGYCYIYAIALAHVFDKEILIIWDVEAVDDNFEQIGEYCLVHAFITTADHTPIDAGGHHESIQALVEQYPCNCEDREAVSIERMYGIAKEKGWEIPTKAEIDAIILYIKNNTKLKA